MFQFLFIDHWIHYHLQLYEGSSWVCCLAFALLQSARALISPSHYFRQIPFRLTSITFNFSRPNTLCNCTGVQSPEFKFFFFILGDIDHRTLEKSHWLNTNCCKAEFFFALISRDSVNGWKKGDCGGSRKLTSWECETQAKYMRSEVSRVLIFWFLWGFLLSTFLFILISSLLLCIGFSQKVCQLASRGFSEIWIST